MDTNSNPVSRVRLQDFETGGFDRGACRLKEMLWYLTKMVFFLSAFPYPNFIKLSLLEAFGAKVGKGVIIKPRVNIHFPWKIEIGNFVWIGEEVFILNFEEVLIGSNVCISQRTLLCGGNHDYKKPYMPYRNGPIILQDGVWVGACCFVGPNVTIGFDTVVTAASVVTSNLNSNSIYRGNPAIYIKNRWNNI
jgi:putative colanic acid biosynthesis acetyltransferase WcaF